MVDFLINFWEIIKTINSNLIAIILAISGWLIALRMQNKNIKLQLKTQIKYDVYKQLVVSHKETQDCLSLLIAKARPPFVLMDSSMIPFNLKLKKEYKDQWIEYSETECLLDGNKKWADFISELNKSYFDFTDKHVLMLYLLEDWMGSIKELNNVKDIFVKEIKNFQDQIYKDINILQSQTKEFDWRKWNKEELNKISENIVNNTQTIAMYISDFMVLAHNNLISGYFDYTRPTRKTFDEKYKVLTKNGIIVNLETDPEKVSEFNNMISEINQK